MRLLIIEDDKHIADNIKKGLELQSHIADVAYDGNDGYDFALVEEYDVIILDRMLPGMDGMVICEQLRKEGITTPILMLTAKTLIDDRVDGLNAGADDYLGKPFAFKELVARIHALSRRPQPLQKEIVSLSDLKIDLVTQQVSRDGMSIDLSRKEYALLEFLARNAGIVFSSEDLIEKVWSYDADVTPNTAQVYIGYLRNKIDKPFPNKPALIKTIRGFGYKLEVSE
ncbi:response regulator transcription factor [candidate division WWE3 bacterium]|uniref:Response regulator transcription factor n=1 Tax=candidate division WWE3 bacterium TaxID=2053526 RepID=A0A955RX55_UNCKA|nr:response regulator transcription factor [candidate division WWE3 bacterium]